VTTVQRVLAVGQSLLAVQLPATASQRQTERQLCAPLCALQISPGDSLELESSEDHIILRPATGKGRMYKKQGVWVFDSGVPLQAETVNRTIRRVRAERDRHVLGKYKK